MSTENEASNVVSCSGRSMAPLRRRRWPRGGVLCISLAATVLVPACGNTATASQQPATAVSLDHLVTAAQRSIRDNLRLYSQTQIGDEQNWFTEVVTLEGQNFAVNRLSPTSRLATDDSAFRHAPRAADGMSIGCAWYERQPDGTYWEEPATASSLAGPLDDVRFITHLTTRQLNGPIDVAPTGGGDVFSLSFRYSASRGDPFDSLLTATVEHGLLRQVTLVLSDGLLGATTHILIDDFGRVTVSAPPLSQISRTLVGGASCPL